MQTNKPILALFDFCETIVDFQSAAAYLELAGKRNPRFKKQRLFQRITHKIVYKCKRKIFPALYRFTKNECFNVNHLKNSPRYPQLKDFPLSNAQDLAIYYAEEILSKHINNLVIDKLLWHRAQGHRIVVVSGGFEIYIRPFMRQFGVEDIVAIKLESKPNKRGECVLSGEIAGLHTMEYRKILALDEFLDLSEYDLDKSYAYSDCPSDIALLSLVGNPIVVESKKPLRFAEILGYEIMRGK